MIRPSCSRRGRQAETSGGHSASRPATAVVLVLHQLHQRRQLGPDPLCQPVPEQLVLDRVMVVDQAQPEVDVVRDLSARR